MASTRKSQSVKTAKAEQRIYIGPNLLQLTAYTVVSEGFPVHIQSLVEKCPAIEKLFVPVSQFTSIEPKTKTKGTLEYRHFNEVIDFIKAERKGE